MNHKKYIECECSSYEHIVIFSYNDDDPDPDYAYVHVQLVAHGFFSRIWAAIKHIFGYKCKYGHWDETMLGLDKMKEIRDVFAEWIKAEEAKRKR